MKTIIILCVVLIGLHSCGPSSKQDNKLSTHTESYNKRYHVYTLNGCEYIVVDVGQSKWGSHKGDCKNPIHCNCI
ncbi:hypothetical protein UFOVP1247_155 [uncultured Caudovirales phage]|jgi:hypothetical protein|uniref:Uncharacterized protein n=1 Tax=uncultured Caudovirales phage TaxID=2100421 RepID=A0A6J5RPS3_9CAUD|nr:hypothetical protein UFOVP970_195 [uncultured Caudovirales phage]CAB4193784.1 hypothetical protein UFOVP1247_155 [uncultured Caudovirales phage]